MNRTKKILQTLWPKNWIDELKLYIIYTKMYRQNNICKHTNWWQGKNTGKIFTRKFQNFRKRLYTFFSHEIWQRTENDFVLLSYRRLWVTRFLIILYTVEFVTNPSLIIDTRRYTWRMGTIFERIVNTAKSFRENEKVGRLRFWNDTKIFHIIMLQHIIRESICQGSDEKRSWSWASPILATKSTL